MAVPVYCVQIPRIIRSALVPGYSMVKVYDFLFPNGASTTPAAISLSFKNCFLLLGPVAFFHFPGRSLVPVIPQGRVQRARVPPYLHVPRNWNTRGRNKAEFGGFAEHPAALLHGHKIAVLDPAPPLVRVAPQAPAPDLLKDLVAHVAKGLLRVAVGVILRPSADDGI